MVHKGIPVKNASSHFNDIKIVVPQGHPVPKNRPIARLVGLSVAVFADNVLNCIQFGPAMVGINDNLAPLDLALFVSIHQVIRILWLNRCHLVHVLARPVLGDGGSDYLLAILIGSNLLTLRIVIYFCVFTELVVDEAGLGIVLRGLRGLLLYYGA